MKKITIVALSVFALANLPNYANAEEAGQAEVAKEKSSQEAVQSDKAQVEAPQAGTQEKKEQSAEAQPEKTQAATPDKKDEATEDSTQPSNKPKKKREKRGLLPRSGPQG